MLKVFHVRQESEPELLYEARGLVGMRLKKGKNY